MTQELREDYGFQFEPELIDEISRVGIFMEVSEGTDLIKPGEYIKSMPLLLSGSIKIMRPDEEGEELLLYHLEKGDTCAMTMTCCMGNTKSEIHAITETPAKLLMIPIGKMEEWSSKYKTWRNFVFSSYHARMMELLESVDNIAFNNMDERLENYLEEKVKIINSKHIHITHKDIANDLHTSRVVISRLLKKMENNKKIKLHRSFIEVL
ncbi:MAG TPA: Crp/Fnr family transcriptional regulator [Flavobacteriaceae bacterium]|nr:Crp/Fnr family transcriptional regulator [Flavobacteriaceae bacterium]MAY53561.1 Crp/Fnr family transcriptional regulator [Flavobacteriaceae bacterium]HIB48950.1 Crp/Fnr family transcriptional regulator [Flavobacteriaceae bacterium]HIN97860.1 Crp/Fnr family transcriptional regulator [Flavobacteriaceae bacterium]|tara:strand:- start:90503 stop:91129 length:627 start_codon:yes stop_codon:yes gene_type:complete